MALPVPTPLTVLPRPTPPPTDVAQPSSIGPSWTLVGLTLVGAVLVLIGATVHLERRTRVEVRPSRSRR
jgi:hypothetical protein